MKSIELAAVQTRLAPSFYKEIQEHARMHNRSVSREIAQMLVEAMDLRLKTTHQFAKPRKK